MAADSCAGALAKLNTVRGYPLLRAGGGAESRSKNGTKAEEEEP